MRHVSLRIDLNVHKYVAIVFDADQQFRHLPSTYHYCDLDVSFAHDHVSADELIVDLIRRDPSPKHLTVVSSDHQIQVAAKRRRANFVDSDVWFDRLPEEPLRPTETSTASVIDKPKRKKSHKPKSSQPERIEERNAGDDEEDWLAFFRLEDAELECESIDEPPKIATGQPKKKKRSKRSKEHLHIKDGEEIDLENPFPEGYTDDLDREF